MSGEQHEKARHAALVAASRAQPPYATTDATLAAYFASLAAQGVRLVDAREVAEWLRGLIGFEPRNDALACEFLARFGGGDE